MHGPKKRLDALVLTAFMASTIGWAVALGPVGASTVAASTPSPAPICAINNFFISGQQSDGGAGSYDTYVYLTNSGPRCRLVPIGARGYDSTTHAFVGTTAAISKPDIRPGSLFPYATTRLLGTVAYGQSVSLLLRYADVGMGALRSCGKVAAANSMAFWMTGRPRQIKVAHLVYGLRGAFTSLQTCSKATYLGVSWPSTGPFWFAS
jgi:hypothetical protein